MHGALICGWFMYGFVSTFVLICVVWSIAMAVMTNHVFTWHFLGRKYFPDSSVLINLPDVRSNSTWSGFADLSSYLQYSHTDTYRIQHSHRSNSSWAVRSIRWDRQTNTTSTLGLRQPSMIGAVSVWGKTPASWKLAKKIPNYYYFMCGRQPRDSFNISPS